MIILSRRLRRQTYAYPDCSRHQRLAGSCRLRRAGTKSPGHPRRSQPDCYFDPGGWQADRGLHPDERRRGPGQGDVLRRHHHVLARSRSPGPLRRHRPRLRRSRLLSQEQLAILRRHHRPLRQPDWEGAFYARRARVSSGRKRRCESPARRPPRIRQGAVGRASRPRRRRRRRVHENEPRRRGGLSGLAEGEGHLHPEQQERARGDV